MQRWRPTEPGARSMCTVMVSPSPSQTLRRHLSQVIRRSCTGVRPCIPRLVLQQPSALSRTLSYPCAVFCYALKAVIALFLQSTCLVR
jgi:hypothetical protein